MKNIQELEREIDNLQSELAEVRSLAVAGTSFAGETITRADLIREIKSLDEKILLTQKYALKIGNSVKSGEFSPNREDILDVIKQANKVVNDSVVDAASVNRKELKNALSKINQTERELQIFKRFSDQDNMLALKQVSGSAEISQAAAQSVIRGQCALLLNHFKEYSQGEI